MRLRVVVPMAFGVFGAGLGLRLFGQDAPQLDLEPYLPHAQPGSLAAWSDAPAGAGPALLAAASVLLLFLVLETLIRRLWYAPNEAAALLAAALFLVLPDQVAVHRVAGGGAVLWGLLAALLGLGLALQRHRAPAWAGALLAVGAGMLHPVALALAPASACCLALGGHLRGSGRVLTVGALALLLGGGLTVLSRAPATSTRDVQQEAGARPAAPVYVSLADSRARLGMELFASLPLLAWERSPRSFLPTGFRALEGDWPVRQGVFCWLLVIGVGGLVAGLTRVGLAVVSSLLACLAMAFLLPLWVPGERAPMVLAAAPAVGFLGVLMGAFRAPLLRSAAIGLAVGLVMVGYFAERDLRPYLADRKALLQIPRTDLGNLGSLLAPDRERDPARLVLFLTDIGSLDAYAQITRQTALLRLGQGAPSLRPGVLRDLLELPSPRDALAPRELRELLRGLPRLRGRVGDLLARCERGPWYTWLSAVTGEAEELIPEIMEYHARVPAHPDVAALLRSARQLLKILAGHCERAGLSDRAVALLEALGELSPGDARWEAALGRHYAWLGESGTATRTLRAALKRLDARAPEAALARGALAGVLARSGRGKEALSEAQGAWSILGRTPGAGQQRLQPAEVAYWYVAELALLRYELALELAPKLAGQAHRDAAAWLEGPLEFGLRRIPALLLGARLRSLERRDDDARLLLRELRDLEVERLREKADGPQGRLDHPRWRIQGLRTLIGLLDAQADAAEIGDLRRRLQDLGAE